jgi:glycosyltransferase involved in cell wall biosynthesis
MIPLTALILTANEEANLQRTLAALSWIERIVIVDSFSTDRTLEVAKAARPGVLIVQRAFDTHATQWNFGLEQIETEWVLTLDADYEVSGDLADEIRRLTPAPDVIGYEATFEYRISDKPLRASVYPPRVVLFRTRSCRYYDDGHTQKLEVSGTVNSLAGKIYHDDRKPLDRWLEAQNKYSKIEARYLLARPIENLSPPDRLRRKVVFAAPAMFFYLLFGRGLILDGWPGLVYVCQRTIAEVLLSIRLITERFRAR